ncbi:hypothetical protein ACFPPD_14535 [Cohnella suwonensis]|uniref:Uncharacterized protein n=1 Tax=Cohnella suwonensis TaxID=696072 RepID=A0ABW0LVP6_9BACL
MLLFCEYVIPEANRPAFAAWTKAGPEQWRGVELLENAGQPGVFVEIRRPKDEAEAADMEKERREGRSWREMESWAKGGREGVRIWLFLPAAL